MPPDCVLDRKCSNILSFVWSLVIEPFSKVTAGETEWAIFSTIKASDMVQRTPFILYVKAVCLITDHS